MTKNKKLKARIRGRMLKTGESYTSARARIIGQAPNPQVSDYPAIAGMTDEAVERKTQRTWVAWCRALDELGAMDMSHAEIAREVRKRWPHIGGWWAQSITVGYERIRGGRDVGQRGDKTYAASRSRTFAVPVSALYRVFSQKRIRERWIGASPSVRTSTVARSIRFDWPGGSRVAVTFADKGPQKSKVAIEHTKLTSRRERDDEKQRWGERFDVLLTILK